MVRDSEEPDSDSPTHGSGSEGEWGRRSVRVAGWTGGALLRG